MKKRLMNIISLGIVLGFSLNGIGCGFFGGGSPLIPKDQARDVGDWSLEVVVNGDAFEIDDEVDIQELLRRNDVKMVLIGFWATWSSPSKKTMFYLDQIYQLHKHKGVALLMINLDVKEDKFYQRLLSNVDEIGITCPIPWDYDSEVKKIMDVGAIPSFHLVDKEGKIRYEYVGFISRELDEPPLMDAINYLLEKSWR